MSNCGAHSSPGATVTAHPHCPCKAGQADTLCFDSHSHHLLLTLLAISTLVYSQWLQSLYVSCLWAGVYAAQSLSNNLTWWLTRLLWPTPVLLTTLPAGTMNTCLASAWIIFVSASLLMTLLPRLSNWIVSLQADQHVTTVGQSWLDYHRVTYGGCCRSINADHTRQVCVVPCDAAADAGRHNCVYVVTSWRQGESAATGTGGARLAHNTARTNCVLPLQL